MRCKLQRRKVAAGALLGGALLLSLLFLLSGTEKGRALPSFSPRRERLRQLRGSPRDMRLAAYANNAQQPLLNAERFPGPPELVLAVQARGGPGGVARLLPLLESLRRAEEPGRLLLIVSLERPSDGVAELLRSVRFCPVLQLFFPYSPSFYPAEFPGPEAGRTPERLLDKHHWWWKLRFVWEKVRALAGYGGSVLFVPDDAYLLPDFARVLRLLEALRRPGELLSLGSGAAAGLSGSRAERGAWEAARHRGALALPRELYHALMGCSRAFCTHEDRRWERSLQHLSSAACLPRPLAVLSPLLPRLLLPCRGCESDEALRGLSGRAEVLRNRLFPERLSVQSGPSPNPDEEEDGGGGGWSDVRDHALCQAYAKL